MQVMLTFKPFFLQFQIFKLYGFRALHKPESSRGVGAISVVMGTSTSFSFTQPHSGGLICDSIKFGHILLADGLWSHTPSNGESSFGCDPPMDVAVVSSMSPGSPGYIFKTIFWSTRSHISLYQTLLCLIFL